MPTTPSTPGDDGGGERNALLMAIQKGKSLKKVDSPDAPDAKLKRRATIAAPSKAAESSGGDLMSALKARMDLRRRGISGSRKAEEEGAATADAKPALHKSMTMPTVLPSAKADSGDAPISMAGIASALKAAASNRKDASDDDEEWSDDD